MPSLMVAYSVHRDDSAVPADVKTLFRREEKERKKERKGGGVETG